MRTPASEPPTPEPPPLQDTAWVKRGQEALAARKQRDEEAFVNLAREFFPEIKEVDDYTSFKDIANWSSNEKKWEASAFGKVVWFTLKNTDKMGELRTRKLVRIDFDWSKRPENLGSSPDGRNFQAKTVQPDSIRFFEHLEQFLAKLKTQGYKVQAEAADKKRASLYDSMFQRAGWSSYAKARYESFKGWLSSSEEIFT